MWFRTKTGSSRTLFVAQPFFIITVPQSEHSAAPAALILWLISRSTVPSLKNKTQRYPNSLVWGRDYLEWTIHHSPAGNHSFRFDRSSSQLLHTPKQRCKPQNTALALGSHRIFWGSNPNTCRMNGRVSQTSLGANRKSLSMVSSHTRCFVSA